NADAAIVVVNRRGRCIRRRAARQAGAQHAFPAAPAIEEAECARRGERDFFALRLADVPDVEVVGYAVKTAAPRVSQAVVTDFGGGAGGRDKRVVGGDGVIFAGICGEGVVVGVARDVVGAVDVEPEDFALQHRQVGAGVGRIIFAAVAGRNVEISVGA